MQWKKGDLVWVPVPPSSGIRVEHRRIRVEPATPAGARQMEVTATTARTINVRPVGGGPVEVGLHASGCFQTAEEATKYAGRNGNGRADRLSRLADGAQREADELRERLEVLTARVAALRALRQDDASGEVEL